MTTEYRDGTVDDLEVGDGFAIHKTIWPDVKYDGDDLFTSIGGQTGNFFEAGIRSTHSIRIWPGYFKDKEQATELDVEALRSTIEEMAANFDAAALPLPAAGVRGLLDLLPPKPQPTPEEIIAAHWGYTDKTCTCGVRLDGHVQHLAQALRDRGFFKEGV